MAYLLLWSAMERYAALAYGPNLEPMEKVRQIGADALFQAALQSTVARAVISLLLLLEIPVSAASPNCKTVMLQDEGVTQNILNQMKAMSRHVTVGGATLAFIGTIGGRRYVQIIGAAASLLGAVFSEGETIAEAKQQPFQLCETTNEPGKFVIGPLGVAEQIARGVSAVSPPTSQDPYNFYGETGLRFTQERINALRNRCHNCSLKDMPPTR